MNKEFITYEQALALKELGFDKPCFGYYFGKDKEVYLLDGQMLHLPDGKMSDPFEVSLDSKVMFRAPLHQQAFRWFREKYELHSFIQSDYSWNISGGIWDLNGYKDSRYDWDSQSFNTYESAEQDCLDKLIEIVKNK